MYNKFQKTNINKFGSNKINPISGLTPIMEHGLSNAIPIWEMLKITEKQYDLLYKTPIIEQKDEE
jgi:hypothetical protein